MLDNAELPSERPTGYTQIKWVQPVCVRLIFKAITRVFAAGFDPNYGLMPRFDNKLDTANRVEIL